MDGLSEKTNGVPLVCNSRTRKVSSVYKSAKASPFIQVVPSNPSSASSRPSTPANDSATEMHSTPKHLLVGRTSDGLWPSMKSLSLSFGTKNAVSERKTSDLSENARPVEDLLGLRSRKGSANSSKSNSLITPSMGVSLPRSHHALPLIKTLSAPCP